VTASNDRALDAVLSATGPVLLDFDGPVTFLMADGVNAQIAAAIRAALADIGVAVPADVATSRDPFVVLRFAARHRAEALSVAEDACRGGEIRAAAVSRPTPGSREFLLACAERARPVVMVSNNAAEAIEAYLGRYGLRELVRGIVGRPDQRPELMKPDLTMVRSALDVVGTPANHCVFIGDSVTDAEVSQRAGLRFIGFAKTPARGAELADVGAEVLVEDMRALADAVLRSPAWRP